MLASIVLKLDKGSPFNFTSSILNPFLSVSSEATDQKKEFQCLKNSLILGKETEPFILEYS